MTAEPTRPLARRWKVVLPLLGGVLLMAMAATVLTGVRWNDARSSEQRRDLALAAAKQAATDLTTIDFRTGDHDVRRILDTSTGDFADMFGKNSDLYLATLKDGDVVSRGEVVGAAVRSIDEHTAEILVAVNTTVSNKLAPQGDKRIYRIVQRLERQSDSRWLVSAVEFVP